MAATYASTVDGGLADPVFDAQAIFRAVMNGFAEPGTTVELSERVSAPAALAPAAAAILAALADNDTPVWLGDALAVRSDAARWLRFQTGAPITTNPALAAFAVLPEGAAPLDWMRFSRGTPDYPDRSATLILPVPNLTGGAQLILTGPGIAAERRIAPTGVPSGFVATMAANRAGFPLGFDLVLACGTAVIALPRSTRIREG